VKTHPLVHGLLQIGSRCYARKTEFRRPDERVPFLAPPRTQEEWLTEEAEKAAAQGRDMAIGEWDGAIALFGCYRMERTASNTQ
jgi:hypothetical protein